MRKKASFWVLRWNGTAEISVNRMFRLEANWRKYCSPFSVASDFIKQGVVNDKLH
jgi:hypothetical protein